MTARPRAAFGWRWIRPPPEGSVSTGVASGVRTAIPLTGVRVSCARAVRARVEAGRQIVSVRRASLAALMTVAIVAAGCGGARDAESGPEPVDPAPYGEEEANLEVFVDSMELASRELYAARESIIAASGVESGDVVADIGAGSGLHTLLLAAAAGPRGVVYAVDIEPRFLKLISRRAADNDLRNVVAVLSQDDDVTLPDQSVDVAFIADTYHYFADPAAVMASIRTSLRPDGRLIVLDYDFDEQAGPDARHAHVRFGKSGLVAELSKFGFKFVESPPVAGLSDNYMAIFALAPNGQSASAD